MSDKKPRLFYWEEGVGAWVPAPDAVEHIVSLDSFFGADDDEIEIRFKRFDMTDAELDALPED